MEKRKAPRQNTRNWHRYHFFGIAELMARNGKNVCRTTVANISLTGMGVYSPVSVGKGRKVVAEVSFVDRKGRSGRDSASGTVDWQRKFGDIYLIGILFDEELNTINQPRLIEHLSWLIDTYNWPQPYRDKRIAML